MVSRPAGSDQPPVIVIVGETGSGKSALAMQLARKFGGEIIAADSRTVYVGMDIGTAKPSEAEQREIMHYGLDVVAPDEQFTAYDFQQLAYTAVDHIAGKGKLPIIVGGTGLYVDAYLYNFTFRPKVDSSVRRELQNVAVNELQARVAEAGLPLPENAANPRHLLRLLEAGAAPQQEKRLRPHTLVIGLRAPRAELQQRIEGRVEAMFAAGLIDEVQRLLKRYGDVEALRAPGYKAVAAHLRGEIDLSEAKQQFVRADLQLAKRQRTWFNRNSDIHWLDSADRIGQAVALITDFLEG